MSRERESDLEELVRGALEAVNAGDLERFVAFTHPEAEFTSMIAEMEGETFRGHDGVRRWWRTVRDPLADGTWDLQELHVEGERGVARLRISGTLGGVQVSQAMWQAFRARDGLAVWWRFYRDEREAREDVGLPG